MSSTDGMLYTGILSITVQFYLVSFCIAVHTSTDSFPLSIFMFEPVAALMISAASRYFYFAIRMERILLV